MKLINILDQARDVRSLEKMKVDIEINNELGKRAMKGLCDYISVTRRYVATFDWHDDKIWERECDIEYKQDADLIFKSRKFPVEVKVTRHIFPENIFIRKNSVDSLPPNSYVYLSEDSIFSVMKKKDFIFCTARKVEEWGNKLCYVLNREN